MTKTQFRRRPPPALAAVVLAFLPWFAGCSDGRGEASLSVKLVYADQPVSRASARMAAALPPYDVAPDDRILIRVLAPHMPAPMEAWFDRSAGRGVISGVPAGSRIAVEVDEYDNTARTLLKDAPLLRRGWAYGITLSPGENKTVPITMYEKGTMITFAGILGSSGDDNGEIIANQAYIKQPSDMEINNRDEIYFLDYGNQKIKKIDRYGFLNIVAGDRTSIEVDNVSATQSGLSNPASIALDNSDSLYVACTTSNKIRVISQGIISTYAGNGLSMSSEPETPRLQASINAPISICWQNSNGLFFVELSVGQVKLIDTNGLLQYRPDRSEYYGSPPGPITSVTRISSGYGQSLFVSKKYLNEFVSIYGNVEHVYYPGIGFWPEGACLYRNEKIYLADSGGFKVISNQIGTTEYIEFVGPSQGLNSPQDVATDSRGNVYIADTGNHAIRMVVGGAHQ